MGIMIIIYDREMNACRFHTDIAWLYANMGSAIRLLCILLLNKLAQKHYLITVFLLNMQTWFYGNAFCNKIWNIYTNFI